MSMPYGFCDFCGRELPRPSIDTGATILTCELAEWDERLGRWTHLLPNGLRFILGPPDESDLAVARWLKGQGYL